MTADSPSDVHHHSTLHATTGIRLTNFEHLILADSGLVWSLQIFGLAETSY